MKWISCKTRMPHKGERVVVHAIYKYEFYDNYIGPFIYLGDEDSAFYSSEKQIIVNCGPQDIGGWSIGLVYEWKPYI